MTIQEQSKPLTPGRFRWGRNYFGPGFAVETQDKYRLGWLNPSSQPTARIVGGGRPLDAATSGQHGGGEAAAGTRRRGWAGRPRFFGLGRRTGDRRPEVGAVAPRG